MRNQIKFVEYDQILDESRDTKVENELFGVIALYLSIIC